MRTATLISVQSPLEGLSKSEIGFSELKNIESV
jgi:hypothetical protein